MRFRSMWMVLGIGFLLAASPATQPVSVDGLIKALIAQTATFDANATDFTLIRPHPLVAGLPKNSEAEIAKHLMDSFTGNPQKDIYVRYHLIYPLIHPTGKPIDGQTFAKLIDSLPAEIPFTARDYDHYDPPDIGERYHVLVVQCSITVGFPPFQRWVGPPESFKYMDDEKKAKCQPLWDEAQSLQGKFTRTIDREAINYNQRVGKTPWMLKEVRGDALYGMIVSGEPARLEDVIRRIGRSVKDDRPRALESIGF